MNIRNFFKSLLNFKNKSTINNQSIDSYNEKITFEKEIPFPDTLFLSHFDYIYIQDDSLDLLKIKIECNSLFKDSILIEDNSISKVKNENFWIQDVKITIYGKIPTNLILNNFAKLTTENIHTSNIQNFSLHNDSKIKINSLYSKELNIKLSERSFFDINQLFSDNLFIDAHSSFITFIECFNCEIILKGLKSKITYYSLNNSQILIGKKIN